MALLKAGASVQTLAVCGQGVPDLLVGYQGRNVLLEVKTASGKLNKRQVEWHCDWRGQVEIVRSAEEALAVIGAA